MDNKLAIVAIIGFAAMGLLFSQQTYSQTTLVKTDFYQVELERVALTPNGSITHETVKCQGGDMMMQASWSVTKRQDGHPTPEFQILKELSKVNNQGVAREYEITIANNGPQFVNLRLTALCLDMQ